MSLFVSKNGQTFGPHEPEEIAAFVDAGQFSPEDYCWQEGWTEWRPISVVLPDRAAQPVGNSHPPQNNGHIPADIEIIGTLKLPDERVVTCRVEGEIHSPSTVIIPAEHRVKARIKAESAIIFGTVEGDIHVTGRAVLKSSSTLHGDIRAARVLIEEGATFNGKSHVNAKAAEPSGKTAGAPARKKTSDAPA